MDESKNKNDEFNEAFIIDQAAQTRKRSLSAYRPASKHKESPEPEPEEMTGPEQSPEPPQGAVMPPAVEPELVKEKVPREENRRRKGKAQPEPVDFKALFIHEADITARSGKTVYVSQKHHERILKILQVIGKNKVSLFAYIYNVLEYHFEEFQDDITELYENNIERIF